jgi:hypothetical protein
MRDIHILSNFLGGKGQGALPGEYLFEVWKASAA